MRILQITGEFPPYSSGGLSTYVYEVTKNLTKTGNQVEVLLIKGESRHYQKEKKPSGDWSVSQAKFEAEDLGNFENGTIQASTICSHLDPEKQISEEPDIIHIHDWYGVLWAIAIKRIYDSPIVISSHLPLRSGFTYTGHHIPKRVKMRLESLCFRISDRIIAPSKFVKKVLSGEYCCSSEKICVVQNGVNVSKFSPIENGNTKRTILSVSRLTEQKGIEYLIESAPNVLQKVPDTEFKIVGSGPLLDKLKKISADMDVVDNIKFLGRVSERRLKNLYSAAAVFACPSVYEPFGLTVLESMASGTPVVGFSIGGLRETVDQGESGLLVQPARTEKLEGALIRVLTDRDLRERLGKGARKRALEFDWQKTAERLGEEYKELI